MTITLTPLHHLILIRLLVPGASGLTPAKVQKDLEPFMAHRIVGAEWESMFRQHWKTLAGEGLIEEKKFQPAAKSFLTDRGRHHALDFLGIESLPAGSTWAKIQNAYLTPRVLDIRQCTPDTRKRLATQGGLNAAILRKQYSLPLHESPTEIQALDALLWKQLGVQTQKKFSLTAVKELLLSRLLGLDPVVEWKKIKPKLAAHAVQAHRQDVSAIRLALIRRWLDGGYAPAATQPVPSAINLKEFALEVQEAVHKCKSGWFGEDKVFISHVYRLYRETFPQRGLALDTFKSLLVQANHQSLLTLSRADLVEAMPRQDVAESETSYLNARYHFIRIQGERS